MATNLPSIDLSLHLMSRTLGQGGLTLPFARDIFLLETHVAGLRYYDIEAVGPSLTPAQGLRLRREPANPYDALAIEVLTEPGAKLGYVPRHRNPILARLMDAGKLLVAEIATLGTAPECLRTRLSGDQPAAVREIRLRISLRDP